MGFLRTYRRGLFIGFLFGTVGMFLLALLSLASPAFETIAFPLLWPGRFFSTLFVRGPSASSSMVALLYACTGILYAVIGLVIHMILRFFSKVRQRN